MLSADIRAGLRVWTGCFLCVSWLLGMAYPSKILLLPAPLYSHCLEVSSIGHELVRRGHEVVIVFASNFDHKNCFQKDLNGKDRIKPIIFQANSDQFDFKEGISAVLESGKLFNPIEHPEVVSPLIKSFAADLFHDNQGLTSLSDERFDIAIVDGFYMSYSLFVIPYKLGIPYIALSSLFEDFVTGRPFLPSVVPSLFLDYSDKMSFWQKTHNAFYDTMFYIVNKYRIPMEEIIKVDATLSRQDVINLVSRSELFLYNTDHILGFPVPRMPNHIEIGGVTTRPANALSGEISHLYENSTRGIVLVTFGSLFVALPQRVEQILIRAFRRLNVDVVWKYLKDDKLGNIILTKWIMQNDALGHPKTKLFISHCGNNGVFEALYHGVPILCTPLFADQVYNSARVRRWEAGGMVNILTATEDEIVKIINNLLNTPKYKSNMKRASAMFHSRPHSPRERAAYWIEHVLKFGGKHLRSRGSEMSTFCYLGYDLVTFMLAVALIAMFVLYKVTIAVSRLCMAQAWVIFTSFSRRGTKQKNH